MSERMYQIQDGRVYVTTSTGAKVECLPYGDLLVRAGSTLIPPEMPTPPTYTMTDGDGEERRIAYSEKSIQDSSTPDEDKAAWASYLDQMAAYQTELAALEARRNLQRVNIMALKAVRVVGQPDLEIWAKEMEDLFGI